MKKRRATFITISVLLHIALLSGAIETREEITAPMPNLLGDAPKIPEQSEWEIEERESKESEHPGWNQKSAKVSIYQEELPPVIFEREFTVSLRIEIFLLVILSAIFHIIAFTRLTKLQPDDRING